MRGDSCICDIKKNSDTAQMLKDCKLIVWDEASMSHKHAFEALDKTLRNLKDVDLPMGGITVLLTGDLRQTLPVIRRGNLFRMDNKERKK